MPMSYWGVTQGSTDALILRRSRGFHLLTTRLPKPRLASGNISGWKMLP